MPAVPLAGLVVYAVVLRQTGFTRAERRLAGTLLRRYLAAPGR